MVKTKLVECPVCRNELNIPLDIPLVVCSKCKSKICYCLRCKHTWPRHTDASMARCPLCGKLIRTKHYPDARFKVNRKQIR